MDGKGVTNIVYGVGRCTPERSRNSAEQREMPDCTQ